MGRIVARRCRRASNGHDLATEQPQVVADIIETDGVGHLCEEQRHDLAPRAKVRDMAAAPVSRTSVRFENAAQNGFEVLEWIRAVRELKGLRTIVLTSSATSEDVDLAYELGANAFFVKPLLFTQFVAQVKTIQEHWFDGCLAPRISRPTIAAR
jgi:DNA-binding NarL/FixJ family response regulator